MTRLLNHFLLVAISSGLLFVADAKNASAQVAVTNYYPPQPVVTYLPVRQGLFGLSTAYVPTVSAAPVATTRYYVPSAPRTTYYAPAAPRTTYYAPAAPRTTFYAPAPPVTTYYAPSAPTTTYYAPAAPRTTFYAPAAPRTTYYAPAPPVTTHYAPSAPTTTFYAPAAPRTTYYAPAPPATTTCNPPSSVPYPAPIGSGGPVLMRNVVGPNMGSDLRLKRDVTHISTLENGIKIYSFKHLWDEKTHIGVMAQDLLSQGEFRHAVSVMPNGFYGVNYAMLGLRMSTLDEWRKHGNSAVLLRSKSN